MRPVSGGMPCNGLPPESPKARVWGRASALCWFGLVSLLVCSEVCSNLLRLDNAMLVDQPPSVGRSFLDFDARAL